MSEWEVDDDRDEEEERKEYVRRLLEVEFPVFGLATAWDGLRYMSLF